MSPLLLALAFSISLQSLAVEAARSYYDVLGLDRHAKDKDIKKAFRKLALQYHPDKNKDQDAEDKFREIAEGEVELSNAHHSVIDLFSDIYGSICCIILERTWSCARCHFART